MDILIHAYACEKLKDKGHIIGNHVSSSWPSWEVMCNGGWLLYKFKRGLEVIGSMCVSFE